MVSFLGLRFGSDKKKLKDKQQEAEKSAKKWKKGNKDSVGSDQSFGHNLQKPQRPSSRPGTSYSSRNTLLFRPFANAAATSSMVDLAPPSPRRPSAGSLRQAVSTQNLKGGRPVISGPIGPPKSIPLGGETPQPNFSISTRPGSSNSTKKDWVNPLDVHFGKDMFSARPSTSAGTSGVKSPLGQLEFDIGDSENNGSAPPKGGATIGPNGYPSPPASLQGDEHGLTRVNTEPKLSVSSKPPSTLRRVNTAEPTRLPSPTASDERLDAPVVRNVVARRETMTFHSPRRRSFSKNIDEEAPSQIQPKNKTDQEKAELKKRRQTEGFEGNFSAFNFGGPGSSSSNPMPTDMPLSPKTMMPPSPLESDSGDAKRISPPISEKRSAKERGMSESMTPDSVLLDSPEAKTSTRDSESIPRFSHQDIWNDRPLSEYNSPSTESFHKHSARPRGDSDTRCPDTPTALRAPPPMSDRMTIRSSASSRGGQSPDQFDDAPPPRLNPDRRSQSPLRSKAPIVGDFPINKGLPRGRRPSSPGSQRDRSPERFDEPLPPRLNPDRRSQSPLRARQPIEGQFPTSKGLPRGRRPGPGTAPIAPISIMQDPAPPRPHRENDGLTSTPNWAERSEKHMSAIPAPLSPMASKTTFADGLGPPRLPSPAFSSLEESMSENFSKAFDMVSADSEREYHRPMISPVLSEFGVRMGDGRESPMRVEASKAPPRPSPITLPPSQTNTPNGSVKSPAASEFSPGFI